MAGRESRVIGLSLKDRSAILPVGRMADGAFWYDTSSGAFGSSTWYAPELPAWVKDFNARRTADGFAGKTWVGGTLPPIGPKLYDRVYGSPFGNELLADLAEAALTALKLGTHENTDLLSVSFSSNDAVGHAKGPDSAEVADMVKRTDGVLARLLATVDEKIGLRHTLVILTADHGVAPLPEVMAKRRMPGGRLLRKDLVDPVEAALAAAFGAGNWVEGRAGSSLYLNLALMKERKLDPQRVEETAARAAESIPHVYRAFTRSQLFRGDVPKEPVDLASPRRLQPRALGRRGDPARALLDRPGEGRVARHALLLRHPHPPRLRGSGGAARPLRRGRGHERHSTYPRHDAGRRDPERQLGPGAQRDARALRPTAQFVAGFRSVITSRLLRRTTVATARSFSRNPRIRFRLSSRKVCFFPATSASMLSLLDLGNADLQDA